MVNVNMGYCEKKRNFLPFSVAIRKLTFQKTIRLHMYKEILASHTVLLCKRIISALFIISGARTLS